MDNLYILLITNRASNIVEDLETLRLLSKGIDGICIFVTGIIFTVIICTFALFYNLFFDLQ